MTQPNTKPSQLCGAKTKAGGICQNIGNQKNGRCYLHGGNSTGPKTAMGKLKSSRNASRDLPSWGMGLITEKEINLINQALWATAQIANTLKNRPTYEAVSNIHAIVEQHRIALETMKYAVLDEMGTLAFIQLQTALDVYYQDHQASHSECHLYFAHISSPHCQRRLTEGQLNLMIQLSAKCIARDLRKMHKPRKTAQKF